MRICIAYCNHSLSERAWRPSRWIRIFWNARSCIGSRSVGIEGLTGKAAREGGSACAIAS